MPLRIEQGAEREHDPRGAARVGREQRRACEAEHGERQGEVDPVGPARRPDLAERRKQDAVVVADDHREREAEQAVPGARLHQLKGLRASSAFANGNAPRLRGYVRSARAAPDLSGAPHEDLRGLMRDRPSRGAS